MSQLSASIQNLASLHSANLTASSLLVTRARKRSQQSITHRRAVNSWTNCPNFPSIFRFQQIFHRPSMAVERGVDSFLWRRKSGCGSLNLCFDFVQLCWNLTFSKRPMRATHWSLEVVVWNEHCLVVLASKWPFRCFASSQGYNTTI